MIILKSVQTSVSLNNVTVEHVSSVSDLMFFESGNLTISDLTFYNNEASSLLKISRCNDSTIDSIVMIDNNVRSAGILLAQSQKISFSNLLSDILLGSVIQSLDSAVSIKQSRIEFVPIPTSSPGTHTLTGEAMQF